MEKLQILQSVYNELGAGYGFNGSEKKALDKINELIQPLIDKALSDAFVAGKSKQSFADFKSEWERIEWYKFTPPEDPAPPSSPTATAETEDKGKRAKAKNVFIRVYQQWYGTGSNYKNNDGDLLSHDDMIFQAMNEFATQEKQQASRATIEECILMLEVYGLGQAVEVLKAKLKVDGK